MFRFGHSIIRYFRLRVARRNLTEQGAGPAPVWGGIDEATYAHHVGFRARAGLGLYLPDFSGFQVHGGDAGAHHFQPYLLFFGVLP